MFIPPQQQLGVLRLMMSTGLEALRQIAERDRFWTDGFTEPALVIMTNREAAKQLVADEAKTGTTLRDPQLHDLTGSGKATVWTADRMPPPPPGPRNPKVSIS